MGANYPSLIGDDDAVIEALAELPEDRVDEALDAGLNAAGQRRTAPEMVKFRAVMYEILQAQKPMTVRQVYYQMVARGLEKTEAQYQRVQQELVHMRRRTVKPAIPFGWIVDGTRWMRKPTTHRSLAHVLESAARSYRRALWADQADYVEVWIEKDALAGVLYPVTSEWDVPLMVSRGFSSVSFLYEAAEAIQDQMKSAYIYLFTDFDRSGRLIADKIEKDLKDFAPDAEIHAVRAAVTDDQVEELGLPTRPPKRKGDPPAVDLDAIPPDDLRAIVRSCIERHVDPDTLRRTRRIEAEERRTLQQIAGEAA